jgi:predicted metal-dependent hydrolase
MRSQETRSIRFGGKEVAYLLKRSSRRKSVGLTVNESGLTVNVPWRASERWIRTVLHAKQRWVLEKLAAWTQNPLERRWQSGETLTILGENTLLVVRQDPRPVIACDAGCLLVALPVAPRREAIEEIVIRWLKQLAYEHFLCRVRHFAPRLGVPSPRLLLSNAKTRWGSCNKRGEVRINWRLIQAPPHLIDYVVVHELAHLLQMNHSPAFWKVVARICPNYAQARQDLNVMARVCRELG